MGKKVGKMFLEYTPQVGRPEAGKKAFLGVLDDVTTVEESGVLLVAGNSHIGEDRRSFEEIVGAPRLGVRNQEGKRMLELCQSKELRVINMMFKKDREKKITCKSGGAETQIVLYC